MFGIFTAINFAFTDANALDEKYIDLVLHALKPEYLDSCYRVLLFGILFSIHGLAMQDERFLAALKAEGFYNYFNSSSGLARVAMMENLIAAKAGSKLYEEFVNILADEAVYKGILEGISYEIQLSQSNENIKGSVGPEIL